MRTFRFFNWLASAAFLCSSVMFVAQLRAHRQGTRQLAAVVVHYPLLTVAMTVSLLYLLLFFGVSVLLGSIIDHKQAQVSAVAPSTIEAAESNLPRVNQQSKHAATQRNHINKSACPIPSDFKPISAPQFPNSGTGVHDPPQSSMCRSSVRVVDWLFVTAVASMSFTAPTLFAYMLFQAYSSGQVSLAAAATSAPEWALPFLPTAATFPWAVICLLTVLILLRETSARRDLERKVASFASNQAATFTASSSVSTSAIAGTNLMVEMQAEQERLQSYVAEYPTGWYKLCDATALERGEVKYVRCLGLHLAVFRGEKTGVASALNAFCPHLGANLALGGKVEGDCLKCPFHEWQFNASGAVSKIPYTDAPLPKAGAVRYPTTEYAGMVLVFYDADHLKYNDLSKHSGQNACKEGAYAPKYYPPAMPALDNGAMTLRGSFKARVVNMPLIEFVLNAVDQAHFACLHSEMMIPWTPWVIPPPFNLITIDHESGWHCGADVGEAGHLSHFTDRAYLKWLGKRLPYAWAQAVVDTTIIGPGGLVRFEFSIPELGKIVSGASSNVHCRPLEALYSPQVLFETHTPLAHMKLRTEFRYFAEPAVPDMLVAYVVGNWYSQWHQDVSDMMCMLLSPRYISSQLCS